MSERGFSLVEVLLSLFLVSFFIMGTAQLIIQALVVRKKAEKNLRISELLTSKLEQLNALPFERKELEEGSASEAVVEGGREEKFWRIWRIDDLTSGMKRVEIEIFSENHPQQRTYLVFFLSQELGFLP